MTPNNPKTIELELDSGVLVHITPLNRYHIAALVDKANELYPLPDKKAFEGLIEEGAIAGGVVIPAEENPVYIELLNEINQKQHAYKLDAMIDLCAYFPELGDKAAVIAHFADFIAEQRQYMDLPEDAWQATWRYAVLRTDNDERLVIQAMRNELPLADFELINEIKIFRPILSGARSRGLPNGTIQTRGVKSEV